MLKILGYLGIAELSFFVYSIMLVLKLPLHTLKEFIYVLEVFLFIWYLFYFVKAVIHFSTLKNLASKIFTVIAFLISMISVCLASLLMFITPSGLGQYKFVKTCRDYDIVQNYEPWNTLYYKYQNKNYTLIEYETGIDEKLCIE
jgi:hypothetical protein